MSELVIGSEREDIEGLYKPAILDSNVHLSDRKDEGMIRKVQSIQIPKLNSHAEGSLEGRVTIGEPALQIEGTPESAEPTAESLNQWIADQLNEIEPEHYEAVEKAITENPPIEPNYLIRVRNVVAQILAQLNRIAEKDRTQIDDMKTKYRNANQKAADLTKELGWHGLKFAGISLGASFLQFFSNFQSDRDIISIFAKEVCPKFGDMFGSSLQANKYQTECLANLIINEYQAKTSKNQSDSSNKQEIINLLDKVLESLKRAAQAG